MALDFNTLKKDGFCIVRGIRESDLLSIVQPLGQIRMDPRSPEPIRDIQPQGAGIAKPNTLSSRYGVGSFPFHTDAAHWERPARYLLLYCVSPGEGIRPTLLQDSNTWQLNCDEMDLACRALWAVGNRHARLSHVAVRSGDQLSIRYDMDCMRPMTAEARELQALLASRIQATAQKRIDWQAASLLAIDNHRMLHARGEAQRPDASRILKRILVGDN